MKKLKLKTEGLTGDNLRFVEALNARFSEMPDVVTADDLQSQVRSTLKGLIKEDGTSAVDFAKLTTLDLDKVSNLFGDETREGSMAQIRSIVKRQGELINALKELGENKEDSRVRSVRDQLKEFHEKNKDKLAAFRSGEMKSFGTRSGSNGEMEAGIEVRVASTMTVASKSNASTFEPQVEVVPGLVDITRPFQPFIENYANTSTTNRPRIAWTEKYNKQGNATFLGEGGVKPLISFEWRSFETYAKKVADKIKVSTEALDDVDWMAAEIEAELKFEVDKAVHGDLLNGAGDGTSAATNMKGLVPQVGGYTLTTIKTTTPNFFDALRAGYTQVAALGFNPTHVFVNPIDGANMDLTKDSQGRPIVMEYKTADGRLFRLTPIETNEIPVGYFLLGDMSKYKIRNYKPFAIYYGWVNDDFEKNLVTVIGERRLHSYLAANDIGAFVYDTFANVKTALTPA